MISCIISITVNLVLILPGSLDLEGMELIWAENLAVELPTCAVTPVEVCSLSLKVLIKSQGKEVFSSSLAKWDPTLASVALCAYNGEMIPNCNSSLSSLRRYNFWLLELWHQSKRHTASHIAMFCKNTSIFQKCFPLTIPNFWASLYFWKYNIMILILH